MTRSAIAKVFLAVALFAASTGCNTNKITWQAQSKSPDGQWVAMAHTEDTAGGFGTDAQWTTVELKQSFEGAKLVEVLVIDEGAASVSNLKMTWSSSSQLHISYNGGDKVLFQAVKAFGQNITVERISPKE